MYLRRGENHILSYDPKVVNNMVKNILRKL